jgi:hypothetical protein
VYIPKHQVTALQWIKCYLLRQTLPASVTLLFVSVLSLGAADSHANRQSSNSDVTTLVKFIDSYLTCTNQADWGSVDEGALAFSGKSNFKKKVKRRANLIAKVHSLSEKFKPNLKDYQAQSLEEGLPLNAEHLQNLASVISKLATVQEEIHGLIGTWGKPEVENVDPVIFTCRYISLAESGKLPSDYEYDQSLTDKAKEKMAGVAMTPLLGLNRLLGTETRLDQKSLKSFGSSAASDYRYFNDRCARSGELYSALLSTPYEDSYMQLTSELCSYVKTDLFTDAQDQSERMYELAFKLLIEEKTKIVPSDSEYAKLFIDLQRETIENYEIYRTAQILINKINTVLLNLNVYFYLVNDTERYDLLLNHLSAINVENKKREFYFYYRPDKKSKLISVDLQSLRKN